jgi:hypothetical protein
MRYPITFYNAIWLVLFTSLFLSWNWWVFSIVTLFCPTWAHIREWHDAKQHVKNIVPIALLFLTSCTKEWHCTTTTSIELYGQTYTAVTNQTFYGTKKEMKAYEQLNTSSTGVTVCK